MTSTDDAMLFIMFKKQFTRCVELKDHIAKFNRSLPGSSTQTYSWMVKVCRNVIEADRIEQISRQRLEASKPGAADPVTPVVPGNFEKKGGEKGGGKGKGPIDEAKKRLSCKAWHVPEQ